MRILMVGAGAVGQAYGYHASQGGAELSFFVRARYREELAAGMTLYPLNRSDPWRPIQATNFGVHTDWADVAKERWDVVWLAVASTALQDGWLREMAAATGDAVVVMMQPGLNDRALIRGIVGADRFVTGLITLQSFHAPLAGASLATPGMAWWFPPLTPTPLGAETPATIAAAQALAAVLRKGGCSAVVKANQDVSGLAASAVMMPLIGALELAQWSFATLTSGPMLALGCSAAREASKAVALARRQRPPLATILVRPWLLRLGLAIAPRFVPFDLQAFLRAHFTKVGDQTRVMFQDLLRRGAAHDVAMPALTQIAAKITPALAPEIEPKQTSSVA